MILIAQAFHGAKYLKHKKSPTVSDWAYPLLAEKEGFEPPVPRSTIVFKTTAIDHSAISPGAKVDKILLSAICMQ